MPATIELNIKVQRENAFSPMIAVSESVSLRDLDPNAGDFPEQVVEAAGQLAAAVLGRISALSSMHVEHSEKP